MNAWTGLLKKEFRQMRAEFLILLGFVIVLFVSIYYLTETFGAHAAVTFPTFVSLIIGAHFFYFPFYMLISLHKESKQLQLWLHNPQSGFMLLGAKVVNGLFAFVVSLALCSTVFLSAVPDLLGAINFPLKWDEVLSLGTTALLNIVHASVYFGVWIIFLWVIYRLLASRIGKLSILTIILVIIAASWGLEAFSETQVYEFLTHWGPIDVFPSSFFMSMNAKGIDVQTEGSMVMYTGYYVFQFVIAIILFLVSGWLIDKKVEV